MPVKKMEKKNLKILSPAKVAYKKKKCIVRSCNHYALVIIAQNYFCVFSILSRNKYNTLLILRTNHYAHIFSVMV